jgi:peroxiredoxin
MALAVLACRLILAAVFVVSGAAKLRDPSGAATASANLGVPRRAAKSAATAASVLELIAAVLLLTPALLFGAVLAVALLLVFTVAVVLTLRHGEHPDCHCFGTLHASPVGWRTVTRNVALLGAGVVILVGANRWPASVARHELASLGAATLIGIVAVTLLAAAVVFEGRLILSILKQNGRLLLRLDELEARLASDGHGVPHVPHAAHDAAGLPVGTDAPAFSLPDVRRRTVASGDLLARGLPVVLIFGDPDCGPCEELLPEVAAWQQEQSERMTVALISRGDLRANMAKADKHRLENLLLQQDDEVAVAFGYIGTPGAVRLAPDGTVSSPVVAGAQAIRSLVRSTTSETAPPEQSSSPAVGAPAPELHLPSMSGEAVDLRSFRGVDSAVLFWNPSCGFCQGMLEGLLEWDGRRPAGPPSLLVVSTGGADANQDLAGLRSAVVLDDEGKAMHAFGATGTPMAMRIDADGRVASTMKIGSTAVLSMLSSLVSEPVV